MNMPTRLDLRTLAGQASAALDKGIASATRRVSWRAALGHTVLGGQRRALAGKTALVAVASQFDFALAMLELDGVAARVIVVPPDFSDERLASVALRGGVDVIVCDDGDARAAVDVARVTVSAPCVDEAAREDFVETEWVLPTSGTTGEPKLVAHSLSGLLGVVRSRDVPAPVWSTFYDIRRYGGLQIFLRAVTGGCDLLLSEAGEPLGDHVTHMAAVGVTHVSGTPSHWRRLLMSGEASRISPSYVRLSGEIADRAILDALAATYPGAKIIHAYASTEAGVVFEVSDGREGFPVSWIEGGSGVEMRVVGGSLHVRSSRTASHYVGRDDLRLRDDAGFVDTDDLVDQIGDRCFFRGRRAGTINVGGLKVHPEEVEEVINAHGAVQMSLVRARRNPITGDLLVADVVLKDSDANPEQRRVIKDDILAHCRVHLERHKAPAFVSFVPMLAMTPAGKLLRREA